MFYEKVVAYCKENNLSDRAFEEKCGLSNGNVQKWKKLGFNPAILTLKKIANATGIPVEKWIE